MPMINADHGFFHGFIFNLFMLNNNRDRFLSLTVLHIYNYSLYDKILINF